MAFVEFGSVLHSGLVVIEMTLEKEAVIMNILFWLFAIEIVSSIHFGLIVGFDVALC